jgi:hypothetical protein
MENNLQEIIKNLRINKRKITDIEIQKVKDVITNLGICKISL